VLEYDLAVLLAFRTEGAQMKRLSVTVFALVALILLGTTNRAAPASPGSLATNCRGGRCCALYVGEI